MKPRLLLIDNYDSFTYNLVQAFLVLGADVQVYRNDAHNTGSRAQAATFPPVHFPGPRYSVRCRRVDGHDPRLRRLDSGVWVCVWGISRLSKCLVARSCGRAG